ATLETTSPQEREALLRIVLREMGTADDAVIAGMLAKEFAIPVIAVPLKIREAELTTVPSHGAQIALELYDARRLPAERFEWMIGEANKGQMYDAVIRILEQRLRSG